MKSIKLILVHLLIYAIAITSCNNIKLIRDKDTRSLVENKFDEVLVLAEKRSDTLFNVFDQKNLSKEEEDGLKYYYSSMPLSDLADYSGDFFLENIRASLKTRNDYTWTKTLPEEIFLHYVLPIRVNNENLDSFRTVYYKEIKSRLEGITDLESAALEINHWCHEKVTYQGADIRTSGPMATILSSRGRCGEESTFTVAALRTAGIPARQVYVPRWAHSDDNHAWVEVWIDGTWKYMGACEPEAILNHGWFTGPASRAMLVHTKTFGEYLGDESVVEANDFYSELNNLSTYANTKTIVVKVVDSKMNPVGNALVEYKLFNYAEFYTISQTYTDYQGYTSFTTGKGSLLLWCSRDSHYGFEMISVEERDTIEVKIGNTQSEDFVVRYNLKAPDQSRKNPTIGEEEQIINKSRLSEEDQIRETYTSTWPDDDEIEAFALAFGYETRLVHPIIIRSMGNFAEIMKFLENVKTPSKDIALDLLNTIAEKDLRDIPASVLYDHLINSAKYHSDNIDREIFVKYVLNPRVANEIIVPWREFLLEFFDSKLIQDFRTNPKNISFWIDDNIKIENNRNYYKVPITPIGSLELGKTDSWSRNILFVALCRSYGVPARLESGTNLPQYLLDGIWRTETFSDEDVNISRTAGLTIVYMGDSFKPEYYTQFTIGKVVDGVINTIDFDHGKRLSDFDWPLKVSPGKYVLVSGNRLNPTEILSELRFFDIEDGEFKTIELNIRERELVSPVLGIISPENKIYREDNYETLYDSFGNGTIITWIDHEREPSKHLLDEVENKSAEFEEWDGNIYILSDSARITRSFNINSDYILPRNTRIGYDNGNEVLTDLFPETDLKNTPYPIVLFVNSANEIIFKSEGYQLGLGDQLLGHIRSQKMQISP